MTSLLIRLEMKGKTFFLIPGNRLIPIVEDFLLLVISHDLTFFISFPQFPQTLCT